MQYYLLLFSHSVVSDSFVTPKTIGCQDPLFMGFFWAKLLEWIAISSSGNLAHEGSNPHLQTDSLQLSNLGSLMQYYSGLLIDLWLSHLPLLICLRVSLKSKFYHDISQIQFSSVQFISVAQSCPTLCDPMNHTTPGLPVHHQLPEFTQSLVHRVGDAIQPSHPLSSPSPPALNPFQHRGLFHWVNSLHEVATVLQFQLQHQSFQWTPRTDLL